MWVGLWVGWGLARTPTPSPTPSPGSPKQWQGIGENVVTVSDVPIITALAAMCVTTRKRQVQSSPPEVRPERRVHCIACVCAVPGRRPPTSRVAV